MRKLIVTTAVLLLALGIAVAQQPAATDTSSQTAQQKSIRGCLGGSEGSFTLLDESGITYKLQGLADDKLKEHVGHTVEISGSVSSGAASSTTGAGAEQTLMVSDIRMISEKCDVKTTEPSGAAAGAQPPASSADMSASAQGSTTTQSQPGTTSDMSQQQAGSQPVSPDTTAQQPATEPAVPPAQEQQPSVAQEQQPAQSEAPPAAAAESGQQETETAAGQLPQTASPLPLFAVLGLGSLAAGLVSRRKK
jgi:LPXTG-motif cell wall-anchored protein